MESKSARLLALILTLIMIGSVFAYATRQSTTTPEREVAYTFPDGFRGYISQIPSGAEQVIYINFNGADSELGSILSQIVRNNMNYNFFSNLRLSQGIEKMLVSSYPGAFPGLLYLFDVNKTKVFFTHDSVEEYMGFVVESSGGISLVDQTSPFMMGTSNTVAKTLEIIKSGGKGSLGENIANFTDRMPEGEYNLVILLQGEAIESLIKGNSTSFFDFYLVGYRINQTENGTFYEKVVLMNFTSNTYFVKSNKTAYYNYTNFEDGLSLAVMMDTNLTKLMQTEPEMRMIEIKMANEEPKSNETSS
jgi:hypothetical protein